MKKITNTIFTFLLLFFILTIVPVSPAHAAVPKPPKTINIKNAQTLKRNVFKEFNGATPVKFTLKKASFVQFKMAKSSACSGAYLQLYDKSGKIVKKVIWNVFTTGWACDKFPMEAGTYYVKAYFVYPKNGTFNKDKLATYKYKMKMVTESYPATTPEITLEPDFDDWLTAKWLNVSILPSQRSASYTYKINLKGKDTLCVSYENYWLGQNTITCKFYDSSMQALSTKHWDCMSFGLHDYEEKFHENACLQFYTTRNICKPGTYYVKVTVKQGGPAPNKYVGDTYQLMLSDPDHGVEVGD